MLEIMKHRGPDGQGILQSSQTTLGHVRLAILDLQGGAQPMQWGKYSITFNGEVYNYRALREQYLKNTLLKSHSDTEVILHLYALLGPACVEKFEGMFALALADGNDLFLARDPLGIKPLYYTLIGDTWYFASEIKALAQISNTIHEFPPGHWYHSRLGWHRYFSLQERIQPGSFSSEEAAWPEIRRVSQEAVTKRLASDMPVGISLSGGLDSSLVAMLARPHLENMHTFAVGVESSPDILAARKMSKFLHTNHHEYIYTQREMLDALPHILYSLESFDTALVRSSIANYFLARLTAEHVKVFLTGEGADEVYGGYDYLADMQDPQALQGELVYILGTLHNTNLLRGDHIPMSFGLEARIPFLDIHWVTLGMSLPPEWKLYQPGQLSKGILRRAFSGLLPEEILMRPKQKFSKGAGSASLIEETARREIGDEEFLRERDRLKVDWQYELPGKEALYYYKILRQFYKDEWILPVMGSSHSI